MYMLFQLIYCITVCIHICSAISNCIQPSIAVGALISYNSHHDSTVARHWEPHVVRVGVDGILTIAITIQVLFISVAPFLCEDLHMLIA